MQKIHWHPAFCSATEWELQKNKSDLLYESEHQLSREPLRVDLLVVRKKEGAVIQNEIGKIFRQHNLVEFKGAGDSLNIDVFHKVLGYAHLYKSQGKHVNEIPAEEITITFICEAYPRELFKQLKQKRIRIKERYPGIFYLTGKNLFPIQIIVTRQLSEAHAGLRILSGKVLESDLRRFLNDAKDAKDADDLRNIDAMLRVSVSANQVLYDKITRENKNMWEALKELLKDEIDNEIKKGKDEERTNSIRELMQNMKWTAEQAMKALGIPETEQAKYLSML